jgi:glycine betaine/proline transport system permease protein
LRALRGSLKIKIILMFKNKRDLFNIGLLVIFVWLLITSYGSSKRKPENIG